jgi:hypothetical protein
MMASLDLVAKYPCVKLHPTELVELYHFKKDNIKLKGAEFEDFDTFEEFAKYVEEQEAGRYSKHFVLLNELGDRVPEAMEEFQGKVLKSAYQEGSRSRSFHCSQGQRFRMA